MFDPVGEGTGLGPGAVVLGATVGVGVVAEAEAVGVGVVGADVGVAIGVAVRRANDRPDWGRIGTGL